MKILSIIGTRPQYIKIKALYDRALVGNFKHIVADTCQHYFHSVSRVFINELDIHIDHFLKIENRNEIDFITDGIKKCFSLIIDIQPDFLCCYGDTNSTLCAALAAHKAGVPIAHIESGLRSFNNSLPEERNRIIVDELSTLKFCPSQQSFSHLNGEGIFSGDLEYELLNMINPKISYGDFGVMTIHRQENMNRACFIKLFYLCKKIAKIIKFYIHHRTTKTLQSMSAIAIPENVIVLESCSYNEMVHNLSCCDFVITDSGSIQKTAPFFGKKTLIMRQQTEWVETIEQGYCKIMEYNNNDIEWINGNPLKPHKYFYMGPALYGQTPSEVILSSLST